MNSKDIYDTLSTKEHNPHYLKRYVKFIDWCEEKNQELDKYTYTESHHIAPKAKDLFPEHIYAKWNNVELTSEQHILAHIILWKVYGGSQSQALECMLGQFNENTNQYLSNRKIPPRQVRKYLAKTREDSATYRSIVHINMANYKDSSGNTYYLHKDADKIKELKLVGQMSGSKHSDETREQMSRSKDYSRKIRIYFLDINKTVCINQPEFEEHLAQGWRISLEDDDLEYVKKLQYEKSSASLTGRADYMTTDGKFFGKLYQDDSKINDLGLLLHKTEARTESALTNQKLAVAANTGTNWYNNGKINKKFKSDPGEEWVIGQKEFEEGALDFRRSQASKANKGTETWNDGVRNYKIKPGDFIDPSWKHGMAPQKPRKPSNTPGTKVYNDGNKNYRVKPGEYVDPLWFDGMMKGVKKTISYTNGIDIFKTTDKSTVPLGYKKASKDQIKKLS